MSTIKANTLLHSDGTTTTQPSIPALDQRMAKAWVNFSGTGTVVIRDSYNVSSITDTGTGSFTANFTNAMTNTSYVVLSNTLMTSNFVTGQTGSGSRTVNGCSLRTGRPDSGALWDGNWNDITIFSS
tara:strand:+ start:302 stop:682 length:381 start_codon:yes stop_codon:yes gene_type:complete